MKELPKVTGWDILAAITINGIVVVIVLFAVFRLNG
jgi:hypothetical protein